MESLFEPPVFVDSKDLDIGSVGSQERFGERRHAKRAKAGRSETIFLFRSKTKEGRIRQCQRWPHAPDAADLIVFLPKIGDVMRFGPGLHTLKNFDQGSEQVVPSVQLQTFLCSASLAVHVQK